VVSTQAIRRPHRGRHAAEPFELDLTLETYLPDGRLLKLDPDPFTLAGWRGSTSNSQLADLF